MLAGVTPQAAEVPLFSTLTGAWLDAGTAMDGGYWYRNLRQTVLFEHATRGLLAEGHGLFVEMSPHPVLTVPVQATIDASDSPAVTLGSLRRDDGGAERLFASFAEAHVHGVELDWKALLPGARTVVDLPTYPFQRDHYWLPRTGRAPRRRPPRRQDAVEARFWEAVEREDLEELAATARRTSRRPTLGAVLPGAVLLAAAAARAVDDRRLALPGRLEAAARGRLGRPCSRGRGCVVVPEDTVGHESSGCRPRRGRCLRPGGDASATRRAAADDGGRADPCAEPAAVADAAGTVTARRRGVVSLLGAGRVAACASMRVCRRTRRYDGVGAGARRCRCRCPVVGGDPWCGVDRPQRCASTPAFRRSVGSRPGRGSGAPGALGRSGRPARHPRRRARAPTRLARRSLAGPTAGRGPGRGARLRRLRPPPRQRRGDRRRPTRRAEWTPARHRRWSPVVPVPSAGMWRGGWPCGAEHLVLTSRRGLDAPGAAELAGGTGGVGRRGHRRGLRRGRP